MNNNNQEIKKSAAPTFFTSAHPAEVRLKNGATVHSLLLNTTMMNLKKLFEENPIAFVELVEKCKNPQHKLFGNTQEILERWALLGSASSINNSVRDIVLSAIEGDGLNLRLVNPVNSSFQKSTPQLNELSTSSTSTIIESSVTRSQLNKYEDKNIQHNKEMKPILTWKDVGEFRGKIVAFYSESHYMRGDRLKKPQISNSELTFSRISKDSLGWRGDGKGYSMNLLIKPDAIPSTHAMTDSTLADDPNFSMRLATASELSRIKELVETKQATFEYTYTMHHDKVVAFIGSEIEKAKPEVISGTSQACTEEVSTSFKP